MRDDVNPTARQVAGLVLALGIVVTGVAMADAPRLEVGGEPGGVVQTVDEDPDRRRALLRLLEEADARDGGGDGAGSDEPAGPAHVEDEASPSGAGGGGDAADAEDGATQEEDVDAVEEPEAVVEEEPAAETADTADTAETSDGDGDGDDDDEDEGD